MKTLNSPIPDTRALAEALASFLAAPGSGAPLEILDRKPVVPTMTFPAEIVTCRLARGRVVKLFCKFEAGRNHNSYGHRGGLAYEAEVYRRVLEPLQTTTPRFIGARKDPATGDTWLILEYIEGCQLLRDRHLDPREGVAPPDIVLAARWIGHFQALVDRRPGKTRLSFLNRYDAAYYLGWTQRTLKLSGPLQRRYPWLAPLCGNAADLLAPLVAAPATIIHGEYYQNNILIRDRKVYAADWESAAIGAGEIDLAALTEGPWPAAIVRQCREQYKAARWPDGAPVAFAHTLAAARLYLHFRWLGERPEWTRGAGFRWRFEELRAAGEQMGMIGSGVRCLGNRVSRGPLSTRRGRKAPGTSVRGMKVGVRG